MKTLVQIIFICSTILSTITLTSCKKDACEGVTCQNGGTCNNGSCNCPDGYEEEFCQTKTQNSIDLDINLNTTSGNAPLDVTATAVVKSGNVSSYTWDFGDGSSALQGSSASHKYTRSGTFTITLKAEGKYNSTGTATKSITVNTPPVPPLAKFSISPDNNIIANKTSAYFSNLSTGTITANQWDFGTGESTSSASSPSYVFKKEGTKTIKLVATGPLGSNTTTQTIMVHAMPPTCNNYADGSSQSESKIRSIRNGGTLKTGKLTVQNDYGSTVKIELFHSDEWLNGKYTPFNGYYWSINGSATNVLTLQSTSLGIGNDWGIKATFSNGTESCIRNIGSIATYSANNGFTVKITNIYN
jgi:PKD repeat protein